MGRSEEGASPRQSRYESYALSPARSIVRGRRLWKSFLNRDFDLPEDHLQELAEMAEHFLGPDLQKELVRDSNEPTTDSHVQAIPGGAAENRPID